MNGVVGEKFFPTERLRQGDPLNLYMFLMCGEGLSSLLHQSIGPEVGIGVRVSRGVPLISHLLFSDDSLIFGEATTRGVASLSEILSVYEHFS
ncbi:hypothetical protein V6N13_137873 [Hibiscus sabdariffa]